MMAGDTRTSGGGIFASGPLLPPDLALQAVGRVRVAAWIFSAVWVLVIGMNDFLFSGKAGAPGIVWGPRQTTITVLALLASLAMVWLSRKLATRPQLLFDTALIYQVLTALFVSLLTEYYPRREPQAISWVCLVILTLPTIAPSSPRKTLAAALAAASTVPFALFITRVANPDYNPPLAVMVWLILPPFLSAALAMIPATVIRGLGKQVTQARELGSYKLEDKIGSGGMGEVYRATHRLLARPAAVKLISRSALNALGPDANRVATERFRREAEAASTLKSPHTIHLYDYGVAEDGTFYYVMELLDGIDLHDLVTRYGPLPPERVAHLMTQVCDSLGEAHRLGMVHRDVKPSNILACRMGLDVDYVKVLDFGLVKTQREQTEDDVRLTSVGAVSGTPAFMSPESVSGGDVGPSSDVYALGCVAYWLLTGKNVFDASNPTMMMLSHIQNAPVPPSLKCPHPVPAGLEQLVMCCLAKNPADRPADAAVLFEMFGNLRCDPQWTDARAHDWWRANHGSELAKPHMTGSLLLQ